MRTRLAAAVTTAALITLTAACSSSSSDDKPSSSPTTAATSAAAPSTDKAIPGLPDKPTGAKRTAYLAALKAVDPSLADDPDKAIDAGRNQCTSLDGGARDVDHSAAERFGNDAHPLSDDQGKAINTALRLTLCPK